MLVGSPGMDRLILSGKNEILKEYREICETVINDKKALYCFYFASMRQTYPMWM